MFAKKGVLGLGYAVLVFMCLMLYGSGFLQSINESAWIVSVVFGVSLIGLIYAMRQEILLNLHQENLESAEFNATDFKNFLAVVIGAVAAYFISVDLDLGAVIAAGIVGVVAALIFPKFGPPAYTGSFVGMASTALLPAYGYILLAGVIAGIVFVISKLVFNGFGGKFGTIAFTGCVITAVLTGQSFQSSPVHEWELAVMLVVSSVVAAVITMALSLRFGHGPVMGSGIVGLLGGVLLPAIFPDVGYTLSVMVICASFAGMANYKRVPNEGYVAIAGLIAGLAFIFTAPYFGGAGGKLGTMAFGSVITVRGILEIVKYLGASSAKEKDEASA